MISDDEKVIQLLKQVKSPLDAMHFSYGKKAKKTCADCDHYGANRCAVYTQYQSGVRWEAYWTACGKFK